MRKIEISKVENGATIVKTFDENTPTKIQMLTYSDGANLNYNSTNQTIVVEDNAMNQMVIKMITKKWLNTKVDFANNGQEGVQKLIDNHYDIILMDLQMPIMDGYEATIAIRNGEAGETKKNIPIIAVTADVMESTKERVFEIGMNHYLSKPIEKDSLFKNIITLVSV